MIIAVRAQRSPAVMVRENIEAARSRLDSTLDDAQQWLTAAEQLNLTSTESLPTTIQLLRHLRTRAGSSLLNVAMLGAFSSGKSFLLSGIQESLDFTQLEDEDGLTVDRYVGLLPSASTPTTCCPATVVPVGEASAADQQGTLRVKFIESSTWVEVGTYLNISTIAAYASSGGVTSTDRLPAHRGLAVEEVEILLKGSKFPAKLYDLPGYDSGNALHDEIIRRAINDADCFIYVSPAVQSLGETDLSQIRFLYRHFLSTKKPVIWVVSGIDRARQRGNDNIAAWTKTVEENNSLLAANFRVNNEPDHAFIGAGFLGVSAAEEAIGKYRQAANPKEGRKLVAASHMEELRDNLKSVIEAGAGLRNLSLIAIGARSILLPHFRSASNALREEQLPLDQLGQERADLRARLQSLEAAIESLERRLESDLGSRLRVVGHTFRRLDDVLKRGLRTHIAEANLSRLKVINELEVKRDQAIEEYIRKPGGPEQVWASEYASFRDSLVLEIQNLIQTADLGELDGEEGVATITSEDLVIPPSRRGATFKHDIVQRTAAILGGVTPIAGGVAAAFGVIAGPVLLIPAGVTAGAALLYAALRHKQSTKSSLERQRSEWTEDLDQTAKSVKESYLLTAGTVGSLLISGAMDAISTERSRVILAIRRVDQSMATPDTAEKSGNVARLTPAVAEIRDILTSLQEVGAGR